MRNISKSLLAMALAAVFLSACGAKQEMTVGPPQPLDTKVTVTNGEQPVSGVPAVRPVVSPEDRETIADGVAEAYTDSDIAEMPEGDGVAPNVSVSDSDALAEAVEAGNCARLELFSDQRDCLEALGTEVELGEGDESSVAPELPEPDRSAQ